MLRDVRRRYLRAGSVVHCMYCDTRRRRGHVRRRITVTCLTVVNQEEGKTTHAAVEISHRYTCHSIGILRCEMPMKGRVLYGHSIYDIFGTS